MSLVNDTHIKWLLIVESFQVKIGGQMNLPLCSNDKNVKHIQSNAKHNFKCYYNYDNNFLISQWTIIRQFQHVMLSKWLNCSVLQQLHMWYGIHKPYTYINYKLTFVPVNYAYLSAWFSKKHLVILCDGSWILNPALWYISIEKYIPIAKIHFLGFQTYEKIKHQWHV